MCYKMFIYDALSRLLYGPPGTGKTLLATCLASELRCPVELLAATDLVGSQMGDAEALLGPFFSRFLADFWPFLGRFGRRSASRRPS